MWYQSPCGVITISSRPQERGLEEFMTEICVSFWIAAIYFGARLRPIPDQRPALAVACRNADVHSVRRVHQRETRPDDDCLPRDVVFPAARGGARQDRLLAGHARGRFGGSQRNARISEIIGRLRDEHFYMKHNTAVEIANGRVGETDRTFDAVERATAQALDVATEIPLVAARTGAVAAILTSAAAAQAPVTTDATTASAPAATPTTSILLLRTGEPIQASYKGTYRLVEFFQVRGNWVYPDLGCVDFSSGTYRECFIGFDRIIPIGKRVTLTGAFYFTQASGPVQQCPLLLGESDP